MSWTTDDELDERHDGPDAQDAAPAAGDEEDATPAAGDGDDAETEDPGPTVAEDAPKWSWRRRVLVGGAAALIVAGFATSGYLGWQLWQDRQVDNAAEQAQSAAVAYAQVLTSIDSKNVDENFAEVLDGSTGEFKDMYSQSSTQLRELLIENEASARGVVLESAVQSASRDQVVVLLFVDQAVQNTSVPDPRIDRSRIKMTMDYVDGRWRASKVELP